MTGPSRRELLTGAGLLAAAGVGLGVVRGSQESVTAAPADASAPAPLEALPPVLHGTDVVIVRPGTRPGTRPEPGSAALPQGTLTTPEGEVVGSFDTSRLESGARPVHLQRFTFSTGTLIGVGESPQGGEFALVGATGSLTASGSYTVSHGSGGGFVFTFHSATEA